MPGAGPADDEVANTPADGTAPKIDHAFGESCQDPHVRTRIFSAPSGQITIGAARYVIWASSSSRLILTGPALIAMALGSAGSHSPDI